MAASYPTAPKTFSTKATNDIIEASHINDLQDEVAAIESGLLTALGHDLKFTDALFDIGKAGATRPRDIFASRNVVVGGDLSTVAWVDYGGTSTILGWVASPTAKIFYKRVGKLVFVAFEISGTSNATTASFTLPIARAADGFNLISALGFTEDNSVEVAAGRAALASGGSTVTLTRSAGAAFTAAGTKGVRGLFFYEAA